MRSSLLKRSVVAVASLAIGSVALAAVPATAAAPAGVTREQVLSIAQSLRGPGGELSEAADMALTAIATATCKVTAEETVLTYAVPTQAGDDADGFIATATILGASIRFCDFGAVAVVDPTFALAGTSTITGQMTNTPVPGSGTLLTYKAPLSGKVAVTAPINGSLNGNFSIETKFSATGASTKTISTKFITKKSKAQKKAAKKKYEKRLKSAKKSYKKAIDKAGKSKSKRAAAKQAYKAKRAAAKAAYKKAIAGFKIVKSTVKRSFSVKAEINQLT